MSSKGIIDLRKGRQQPPTAGEHRSPAPAPRVVQANPRRTSQLRAKRRRLRVIAFGVFVVLCGAATWGVSYASYLPQYTVQRITVTGVDAASADTISQFVHSLVYPGTYPLISHANILIINKDVIARAIVTNFPGIKSAAVTRPAPLSTELDVALGERSAFAKWCGDQYASSSQCFEMDDSGFVFAPVDDTVASSTQAFATPYTFYGALDATSSDPVGHGFVMAHMPGIISLLTDLSGANFTPEGATVIDDTDFSVPLAEGFYIKASFGEDPDMLVKNLQLILSSAALNGQEPQLEYVDLRFGDRVYYKLKGKDQTTAN